jgi:hypothetical protein
MLDSRKGCLTGRFTYVLNSARHSLLTAVLGKSNCSSICGLASLVLAWIEITGVSVARGVLQLTW